MYLRSIFLALSIFLNIQFISAQSLKMDWLNFLPASGWHVQTDQGFIYVYGHFEDTVDFDPGPGVAMLVADSSLFSQSSYAAKYDTNGNFISVVKIMNEAVQISMEVDNAGNLYLFGEFFNTHDFDPGPGVNNLTAHLWRDAFISKLDSNGNLLWVKQLSGANCFSGSIHLDKGGNLLLVGAYAPSMDADPSGAAHQLVSNGGVDIYLTKLDANGDFLWAKTLGSNGDDYWQSLAIDHSENIIASSRFKDSIDVDPGVGKTMLYTSSYQTNPHNDYIFKLNQQGNFLWAKASGTSPNGWLSINDVDADSLGNIYAVGGLLDSVEVFGSAQNKLVSNGQSDLTIMKLDSNGTVLWSDHYGSDDDENAYKVNCLDNSSIYVSGYYEETFDFNVPSFCSTMNQQSGASQFICKILPNGAVTWATNMSFAIGALSSLQNNSLYMSVSFMDAQDVELGPGVTIKGINGKWNHAMEKLIPCSQDTGSVNLQICAENFQWANGTTYPPGQHSDCHTFLNTSGCDSIVYLNLTVTSPIDTAVINSSPAPVLTAVQSGVDYQWLDCGNNYAIIPGETYQSFVANQNGSYAVMMTNNNCVDTSSCMIVGTIGIEEWTESELEIYPNPNSGQFTLELNQTIEGTLEIYSLNGQKVYQQKLNGEPELELELGLAKGVYVLRLSGQNKNITERLIIQ